jgi:FkbH-like protein
VVLLRVRDWLRELGESADQTPDGLREFLDRMVDDLDRAIRSHRANAAADTAVVVCPDGSGPHDRQLEQAERLLIERIEGIPGLHVVRARDHHDDYEIDAGAIADPLREKIAHIPYRDEYLYFISALVVRQAHCRLAPARKVVVVDCDNTLWRGVVGEVGAEGIEFDEAHHALHARLAELSGAGVLVCLCSKNEEDDVWRVFETRSELRLRREQVVAAAINWQSKSGNLRRLAAVLNLGLDSFIFIDDNPVECAEVRASCPEVLTIQWPADAAAARRLLRQMWELAPTGATAEDARRTAMYRQELQRRDLQGTLSFADFLNSLELVVDARPLDAADLKRASQLTLRTNQFNFTTRRRNETEMQAVLDDGRHFIRTIRVRDRFGDYGLVGLIIAEARENLLDVDTFLLSCRVLGRGVEHRLAADLGTAAVERGLAAVRLRLDFTSRNTPARKFLQAFVPEEYRRETADSIECEVPAAWLSTLQFDPSAGPMEPVAETEGDSRPASALDTAAVRAREQQISRAVQALSTTADLRTAIDGESAGLALRPAADVSTFVHQAFSGALGVSIDEIKRIDSLEALGCDSFKIVEITVALIERFPALPPTLLFEHRSVSEIVRQVGAAAAEEATSAKRDEIVAAVVIEHDRDASDIAVVGMHARCAGANAPDELWQLLSEGEVAVRAVPADRPEFLKHLSDSRPHWAGLLDDPARFDAELFGVAPREADVMDPQLRVFLEVASAALEDAGSLGNDHDPNTGVFVGVMYGDYAANANYAVRAKELPYRSWESFSLANRLSQLLGFHGPSMAVDTACSSSATALHFACRALTAGDCNVAIVGGVNLILDPDRFVHLGRLGILSMTGRCLAFGADADGTVLGEGAGAVVLRRAGDAKRRGDRILGIIKGTGVSTGSGTVGFTAPNPQAQAEAIRRALLAARVDPRTIGYVETHGTGTSLGDPIEVRGLTIAHSLPELRDSALEGHERCSLGSIKPNIGHLEAGAGVLGLIKVLLQLQHRALLPSVTSEEPNPQIPFAQTPFYVQRQLERWQRPRFRRNGADIEVPRRAGLSSFGVGGSNAHVIIEEPPEVAHTPAATDRSAHVLALSARNDKALRARASQLAEWLDAHPEVSLADTFFSANTGRRLLDTRVAVVARSRDEAAGVLKQFAAGQNPRALAMGTLRHNQRKPALAFLFTGQGSQHARMGAELYHTHPVFRDALDRCAAIFDRVLGRRLVDILFAQPDSDEAKLLNQTGITQPALFSYEYALAQLWESWGVTPDFVMGHSVGEIAAMCVAGGVSLEDGLELIAARGGLMQALPAGGAMASVMADEARVLRAIAGRDTLAVAALNGPSQTVISGDGTAVAEVVAALTAEGVKSTPLAVSHAFHSPLMRPMIDDYLAVVRNIRFSKPRVPLVTGVHGEIAGDEITRPEYWIRNVLDPVRFTSGMATLARADVDLFLEIGPQPVMVGMGRHCIPDNAAAQWLASARRDADAWATILAAAGRLYAGGIDIDWKGFDAPFARKRVTLPA